MKKIIILGAFLALYLTGYSQTVQKTKEGNYIAVNQSKMAEKPKDTGKTFTDQKGNVFNVYVSKNGKLFVIRTSKNTGKEYRQYLKLD